MATAIDADPEFGDRVRDRREALGLTQQQLADAVGVQRVSVQGWEYGQRGIRPRNLRRLAAALECDENWLRDTTSPAVPAPADLVALGERLEKVIEERFAGLEARIAELRDPARDELVASMRRLGESLREAFDQAELGSPPAQPDTAGTEDATEEPGRPATPDAETPRNADKRTD